MKKKCIDKCDFYDSFFIKYEYKDRDLVIKIKLWKDNYVDLLFKNVKYFRVEDGEGSIIPYIINDEILINKFVESNAINIDEKTNLYFLEDRDGIPCIKILANEITLIDPSAFG